MISQLQGNCTSDDNPDAWFPTLQESGGDAKTLFARMVPEIKYAIGLCSSCPVQDRCLEEGMKPENLAFGIWGGRLAGQRIAMARERGIDYRVHPANKGRKTGLKNRGYMENERKVTSNEEKAALLFTARIRPYLEV